MILDPVRPGRKRALSAEAREGLARIVTLLLSDEPDTRAQSVTVLSQHCTAEIRRAQRTVFARATSPPPSAA